MNRIFYLLLFGFFFSQLSSAQESRGMERLLYEFPHGRPAYSPLLNELEIAPHTDLWKNDKSIGAYYGMDMEYAVSRQFILEAGYSNINNESNRPAFISESGLELAAFYTILDHSKYVITFGMEGHYNPENEANDPVRFSVEPSVLFAAALDRFQIHLGINAEISSSVKPGFYIAGIYSAGFMRPFIEILEPNEGNNSLVITPGVVIPIYEDIHCGIGVPLYRNNNLVVSGLTLFVAVELGEE